MESWTRRSLGCIGVMTCTIDQEVILVKANQPLKSAGRTRAKRIFNPLQARTYPKMAAPLIKNSYIV